MAESPIEALKMRFVNGEISLEKYREMLSALMVPHAPRAIVKNDITGIDAPSIKRCLRCGSPIGSDCTTVRYPGKTKGSYELTDPKPICQPCIAQIHTDDEHVEEIKSLALSIRDEDHDKAIQILKSIFNSNDEAHYYNLGNQYLNKGMLSEALDCFDNALLLDTHYVKAWYRKGSTLMRQGEYADASKCFNNIYNLDPKNERGWIPASAFCLFLCSIVIHNTAVLNGKDGTKTKREVLRWTKACNPVMEFAYSKGYDFVELGVDAVVDFCFENHDEILDYLEPLDPNKITIHIYESGKKH